MTKPEYREMVPHDPAYIFAALIVYGGMALFILLGLGGAAIVGKKVIR